MAFGDEVMPNHEYLTSVCTCADRLVNMSNPWFMKTWILVCLGLNFLDNRLILSTRWLIIQNRIIIKRKPKKDVVQKLQKQIANPLSYDTSNCASVLITLPALETQLSKKIPSVVNPIEE